MEHVAVILAAGKGTRMKSDLPKVAIPLAGKPLLLHVFDNLLQSGVRRFVFVVGYKKEDVISLVPRHEGVDIDFVEQSEQKGTAHALMCCRDTLGAFQGELLVTCGDMPLIQGETFARLLHGHHENGNMATVLSSQVENPFGYGRLVRDDRGALLRIVEEKDANDEIRKIREVNTGTYVFRSPDIFDALDKIGNANSQQEYYLPDVVQLFRSAKEPRVGSVITHDSRETAGVNSPEQLKDLEGEPDVPAVPTKGV